MHIRQLRIQNLACFDDVTFDFTNENGEPCRWVVLLGENGTGKSTALRALVAGVPFDVIGRTTALHGNYRVLLRGPQPCSVHVAAISHVGDFKHSPIHFDWAASFRIETDVIWHDSASMPMQVNSSEAGWFLAAYRPWRGGIRLVESGEGPSTSYALPAPRNERVESLFDSYNHFTLLRDWLFDLDWRRTKAIGKEKERADALWVLAVRAIESVFPKKSVKIKGVTQFKDVIVQEDGVEVSIGALSDGYQSAMNWIGDLTRRLVEAFPTMDNPLHAHGVVLVDEIDLHLHPKWQRTIVEQIRTAFPNLQFIVTTHSPFIAQDMTEHDKIIVLKRDGGKVTVTEDSGFVQGWRVDQILTSRLFGLSETRGHEVEVAEQSRQELLDKRAQNGLTSDEQQTLSNVNDLIAQVKSSPDEKPEANDPTDADLRRAANDLLQILAKRNLKPASRK